jgi:hypothetical protein
VGGWQRELSPRGGAAAEAPPAAACPRRRPPLALPTCPPLVTTDLYHRHLTLNLLSVWPSAGTSSAGGGAAGAADQRPERVQGGCAPTQALPRTCRDGGAVGPPTQHVGLKRHAADGVFALQPGAEHVDGA